MPLRNQACLLDNLALWETELGDKSQDAVSRWDYGAVMIGPVLKGAAVGSVTLSNWTGELSSGRLMRNPSRVNNLDP